MKAQCYFLSLAIFCSGLLALTGPAAMAAPYLQGLSRGSNIVLNFSGRLQTASRVEGPYTDVVGARNPYDGVITDAALKFWRAALDESHTVAIRSDGTLWAWGNNTVGQLGNGTWDDSGQPVRVGTNTNWRVVSAGSFHTVALRDDGTLWAWGANSYGQLGIGVSSNTNRPVQIGTDARWLTASAGHGHTLAVRDDGTLWAWGWNDDGALGTSTVISRTNAPVPVETDGAWKTVSAAMNGVHSLAVRKDGTLWAWGWNSSGRLGTGNSIATNRPTQVGTEANWQAVAAGGDHSAALRDDGSLWTWGSNSGGQLGNGTFGVETNQPVWVETNSTWRTVVAGAANVAGIRTDGTLWTWGANGRGQLGLGAAPAANRPMQVGTNANWQALAFGYSHVIALRDDGTLWTWGTPPDQIPQPSDSVPRQIPGTNWGLPR
jgi:alpha-tubulin suppressor-like RCC1 family protein